MNPKKKRKMRTIANDDGYATSGSEKDSDHSYEDELRSEKSESWRLLLLEPDAVFEAKETSCPRGDIGCRFSDLTTEM
jgi:hypothetical protein